MTGYIFSSSEAKRVADTVRSNEGEVQRRLPPRPRPFVPPGGGGGGVSGGDSGGDSGGSSGSCCSTVYSIGPVDSNSLEWATDYLITGAAAPLADITVTDQGSDTWESDTIDVTCNDPVDTDEYTATMVVSGGSSSGVPAGGIVLTIAMTLGGDSGDSICCDSLATGFVHKYTNAELVVNPLAGFKLKPMQTGTAGQACADVVCELCVVPAVRTTTCNGETRPTWYRLIVPGVSANINDPCSDCSAINDISVLAQSSCDGIKVYCTKWNLMGCGTSTANVGYDYLPPISNGGSFGNAFGQGNLSIWKVGLELATYDQDDLDQDPFDVISFTKSLLSPDSADYYCDWPEKVYLTPIL